MIAKGSLAAIIKVAKKEVGTIEGPKDNETKYGKWTGMNFQPWCQSFVSWCAFKSGLDAKKYPKSASTIVASDWFKKKDRWADARNDEPTPGDWIYFDFPEDGVNRISHVGICIKNNGDGTIQVIEGNTSGTAKGDQRNGGMCVEKTRAYVKNNKKKLINGVVGWGRPVYAGEENLPLLSKVGPSDSVETVNTGTIEGILKASARPAPAAAKKAPKKTTKTVNTTTLEGILKASAKPAAKKAPKKTTETVNTTTLDGILKASKNK